MKYSADTVVPRQATEVNAGARRDSRERINCPGELWS